MKSPLVLLLPMCSLLLASCVSSIDLIEVGRGVAERGRKPLPEEQWNKLGIWQRVSDQPATYIPKGYPVSSPRTDNEGRWVVDKRDGKRLFVPNRKVCDYEPGVLRGEAKKVTNWTPREYNSSSPGIMTNEGILSVPDALSSIPQSL